MDVTAMDVTVAQSFAMDFMQGLVWILYKVWYGFYTRFVTYQHCLTIGRDKQSIAFSLSLSLPLSLPLHS